MPVVGIVGIGVGLVTRFDIVSHIGPVVATSASPAAMPASPSSSAS